MIRIKKYGNRRLYNTESSQYMNLEDLSQLIRAGERVEVLDAATGADLTRQVLFQVILERGGDLFPPGLLHRVIRALGDSPAERVLFQQLRAALELLDAQQSALEQHFPWMRPAQAQPEAQNADAPPEAEPDPLDELRGRLAGLEARLRTQS